MPSGTNLDFEANHVVGATAGDRLEDLVHKTAVRVLHGDAGAVLDMRFLGRDFGTVILVISLLAVLKLPTRFVDEKTKLQPVFNRERISVINASDKKIINCFILKYLWSSPIQVKWDSRHHTRAEDPSHSPRQDSLGFLGFPAV